MVLPDAPVILREIVASADAESRRLRHGYIGTEHLLLALLLLSGLRAAALLKERGVEHAQVDEAVTMIVGVGEDVVGSEQLPFTPRSAGVLRRVAAEAERLGKAAIGSEHVLRALLRSRGSVAARILEDLGIDTSRLADTLRRPQPEL